MARRKKTTNDEYMRCWIFKDYGMNYEDIESFFAKYNIVYERELLGTCDLLPDEQFECLWNIYHFRCSDSVYKELTNEIANMNNEELIKDSLDIMAGAVVAEKRTVSYERR